MYGVKVFFEDSYMWVTEVDHTSPSRLKVKLFSTFDGAEDHANIWRKEGHEDKVMVESYDGPLFLELEEDEEE